ncbi:MAG: polysaccharide export outer membrane protein [Kiritimatiellia bacterium]|jgi:polysaccharide export outer membrane protein
MNIGTLTAVQPRPARHESVSFPLHYSRCAADVITNAAPPGVFGVPLRTALVALIILALPGSSFASSEGDNYKLGAGDTVKIEVYGEEGLSREARITSSCRVEVQLIGAIEVCGRTRGQVATDIRDRLAAGYLQQPTVFVDVSEYGSQRIEIKGAVKKPGVRVLEGPTSLSEAITLAGGPDSPNVMRVQLITEQGAIEYSVADISNSKDPVWVQPGNTVILLPPVTVQVFGEVKTSGPVAYNSGMSVTEALGLAGGTTDLAGLNRAYVLRADGKTQVRINIRRIQRGQDADVLLQPNDQLVIRRSIF